MSSLPRPDFVDRNPQQVEQDLVQEFESLIGRVIYPAQPERLLINLIAYRETLVRLAIQNAGEQNLVNYATGNHLDQLGAFLDVTRLPAAKARCTIRFTKDIGAVGLNVVVPRDRQVETDDGRFAFATIESVVIPAGQMTGTVTAVAIEAGASSNDLPINTITKIFNPINNIASATNTTASSGGADVESDDRFRSRIKLAPNRFSVAGPVGAYRFWTLSIDQSIVDVAIISPARVKVKVYPLTSTGLPSSELRQKIETALLNSQIRPLTDDVEVLAPTVVNFTIEADITLLSTADQPSLETQLDAAAAAHAAQLRSRLGVDIVPSQIIAALQLPGVYEVDLIEPSYQEVFANEWANCTAITINVVGLADG